MHYDVTTSPCVGMVTLKIVLALICVMDLEVMQLDRTVGFLQVPLDDKEINATPMRGVKVPRGADGRKMVLRIRSATYGLKRSSFLLFNTLRSWLLEFGFD